MNSTEGPIEVWADVRCPWCWVGHRRLLEALQNLDIHAATVTHRAFLLEPQGPPRTGISLREAALTDWGMSPADWERSKARIEQGGRDAQLDIRTDTARIFDSRDVHRLLKLADADADADADVAKAWETVFAEHFNLNTDLGDHGQLVQIGAKLGLEEVAVEAMLTSSDYAAEVAEDVLEAGRRKIGSVPTVEANGRRLSGSHSAANLAALLTGEAVVTS